MKNQKRIMTLIGVSSMLLFSGCSTDNLFGVGKEKSACESSKGNGFCGAPSSIYKYKEKMLEGCALYNPDSFYTWRLFADIVSERKLENLQKFEDDSSTTTMKTKIFM